MDFLTARLEEATGFKLDITRILDFVGELSGKASQDSQRRVNDFQQQWENDDYVRELKLVYISGSWKPQSVADSKEVLSQKSWEDFLQNLDFQFSTCRCPFKPLPTCTELPKHEFWKGVYNSCGGKAVTFIAEKCLMLSCVENGFFMLVAAERSILYQKIMKFKSFPKRFQNQNQAVLRTRGNANPYKLDSQLQLTVEKKQPNSGGSSSLDSFNSFLCSGRPAKRKTCDEDTDAQLHDQFHKKVKLTTLTSSEDSGNCDPPTPAPTLKSTSANANTADKRPKIGIAGIGIKRWFIPTLTILENLIQERENIKQMYTAPGASSNSNADRNSSVVMISANAKTTASIMAKDPQQLNFVGIFEDSSFAKMSQNNLHHVLKQSKKMSFPGSQLPQQWEGLKIKIPSGSGATSKKSLLVNVFQISETFAMKNNIRVKVKQRRKKKPSEENNLSDSFREITISNVVKSPAGSGIGTASSEPIPVFLQASPSFPAYDPLIMLDTSPSLYNKSSWSRLSQKHVLYRATSSPNINGEQVLLDSILGTPVGSHFDSGNRPEALASDVELEPLAKLLKNVVTFHSRVKDVHKLVKKCLTLWIMKSEDKLQAKEQRSQNRKNWRAANPKLPKTVQKLQRNKKKSESDSNSVEMIDLTVDTPSTNNPNSDPNFSVLKETSLSATILGQGLNLTLSGSGQGKNSRDHKYNRLSKFEKKHLAFKRLKEVISSSCVTNTLKQIFYLSHMNEILGSRRNVRGFFTFVRKSVVLAGTKSSLQLGQLMSLLNPSDCEWLQFITNESVKTTLLAKVLKWIFTEYLLTILKLSFYITEISNSRLHSCFYLRETWKSVVERQREHLIKLGNLQYIGPIPPRIHNMNRTADLTNSRMRFLPKKNFQLRPIVSRRREKRNFFDEKNGNMLLNHVIKEHYLYRFRDPHILRLRWLTFIDQWRSLNKPKLYYAKMDIKDAYPSVDMSKLRNILEELRTKCDNVEIFDIKVVTKSKTIYRQVVASKEQPMSWTSSVFNRPCVVMLAKKVGVRFSSGNIFHKLLANMQDNTVKLGKHKYNFDYGLPQGCVLSEALCNVYYGNLDSTHLSGFLNRKGEFFATSVDDYIYISPKASRVSHFLKLMKKGFPDYNCEINKDKILTNIYPQSNLSTPDHECEWLSFCGWCFCLSCCHVMRDFSYYSGQDMASTLSFIPRNATSPENFLINRMKVMLPARMNRYLLDPAINCRNRIILNVFEAGLIFAFRFAAVCRVMYPNATALNDPRRASQGISAICVCANTLSRLVISILNSVKPEKILGPPCARMGDENGCQCQCLKSFHSAYFGTQFEGKICNTSNSTSAWKTPDVHELLFIIYHAFILKLNHHSSIFRKEVLPRLHKLKKNQESLIMEKEKAHLKSIIGAQMPKHFRAIKI